MRRIERALKGQRFGRWLVQHLGTRDSKTRNKRWWCLCECGNRRQVWESGLVRGHNKSCGCLGKLTQGIAARNTVYDSYRRGAQKRQQSWELSPTEFDKLVQRSCFYCGIGPSNRAQLTTGEFIYSGIDRLDNSKGYLLENCVACCRVCNYMKRTKTVEEFLNHVRLIIRHCRLPSRDYNPPNRENWHGSQFANPEWISEHAPVGLSDPILRKKPVDPIPGM